MALPKEISREFAYEFLSQLGKVYSRRKTVLKKPEVKEEIEEPKFIRPLTRQAKKPMIQPIQIEKPAEKEKEPSLNKIKQLMKDPTTNAIECYGTDKTVRIKRGNMIAETPYVFKEAEIKEIIKAIAKETNTPLKKVFKTRFGNFIINAIISDFIGSKFVLSRTS